MSPFPAMDEVGGKGEGIVMNGTLPPIIMLLLLRAWRKRLVSAR